MDFIDPTLRSSVEREKMDTSNFKSIFLYVIVFIVIVFLVWVGYSMYSSRLDTRPEDIINIDPGLQNPSGDSSSGRPRAPISDTL